MSESMRKVKDHDVDDDSLDVGSSISGGSAKMANLAP